MTRPAPQRVRLTCDCVHCADHADRLGKALPLAVDVPEPFMVGALNGRARPSSKLRHNLVQIGHERSALSGALRVRSGITPA